jgi:hypothetical protein
MLSIPFQINDSEYSVYLGFDDEGLEDIQLLVAEGKPKEVLRLLTRGYAFRPDKGDYAGGKPLSLLNKEGENKH